MSKKITKKTIILSGGGTGGSVIPLLFISRKLKDDFNFVFVGTYKGVERKMLKNEDLQFEAILSGKLRRYFSIYNFLDIFKVFFAFWQSLFLLLKHRPKLIITAGGFVSVPLVIAAFVLRIKVIVHQQDVLAGLANRIMARFANIVTVSFKKSLKYYKSKALLIGNIGFDDFKVLESRKSDVVNKYKLDENLKTLLILGGGTGSLFINNLVSEILPLVNSKYQIIHLTGSKNRVLGPPPAMPNYFRFELLDHSELIPFMYLSDIIISRCGLSTLTEISFLSKASILIPMPNSHQEYNAEEFKEKRGALVLHEESLNKDVFIDSINLLMNDDFLRKHLADNAFLTIKNANAKMIEIIKKEIA